MVRVAAIILALTERCCLVHAQTRQALPIPAAVVDAYRLHGDSAAIDALARVALFPVDSANRARLRASFTGIAATYGRMVDDDLGDHLRQTDCVVLHERGPVFSEFVSYRAAERWGILSYRFDTDPRKVLPPDIWPTSARPPDSPR